MTVRVAAAVDLAVDPETAFAVIADLPSQERWVIATRLYAIDGPSSIPRVGSRMAAFTGFAGVGFLDTMVVTEYDPPHRWVTRHEGDFVRGIGIFQVDPTPAGCRFTWAEELDLPFGVLGRVGWVVVKPLARLGLAASLRRMSRQIKRGTLRPPSGPSPDPPEILPAGDPHRP